MRLLKRILFGIEENSLPPVDADMLSEYYLLECWNQYNVLPESLLPHIDTIKTRQEWENLGFKFEPNKYGQMKKIKIDNYYFSLLLIATPKGKEPEAIKTGKKLTRQQAHIDMLIMRGCSPEEFIFYTPENILIN